MTEKYIDQTVKFDYVIREKDTHGLWTANHDLPTWNVITASHFTNEESATDILQYITVVGQWEVCKYEVVESIIPID